MWRYVHPDGGDGVCRVLSAGGGVLWRTPVGLLLNHWVRYSSTGRDGDELNTGCGAVW